MANSGFIKKVDNLGRIVIPKDIRRKLQIESDEGLMFEVNDKSIILSKVNNYKSLDKMLYFIIRSVEECFKINTIINIKDNKYALAENSIDFSSIESNKYEVMDYNINNYFIKIIPLFTSYDYLGNIIIYNTSPIDIAIGQFISKFITYIIDIA